MCEEEARVVQMHPVEKAIPALSVPVGGSVADVLSLEAVVLGDGGVSSGAVGRYVYIGDVSVSGGVDTVVCGVDTVLSGAVGGSLCDHDRVSGGGDTEVCGVGKVVSGTVGGGLCAHGRVSGGGDMDVCGVDTVVSAAFSGCLCDLDRVSRCDTVVGVGYVSMSGGGELDVCVVVTGVNEPVCGVNSVMTTGELDVCGCDSVVSDEAGESGGVEIFVSVCDVAWVMTHCCPMWFVLVTVCRWLLARFCVVPEWHGVAEKTMGHRWCLGQGWLHLVRWTGSSVQTVPCGPSHRRLTQCVRCCVLLCFIVFCCVLLFILVFYCCVLLFYHRTWRLPLPLFT